MFDFYIEIDKYYITNKFNDKHFVDGSNDLI